MENVISSVRSAHSVPAGDPLIRPSATFSPTGEKAYRVWRIYMAGSAHAFARGWMSIYQALAGRPAPDGSLDLPLTRNYIYET